MNKIIKSLIPPFFINIIKKYSYKNKLYKNYDDALSNILNNGYSNKKILKNIIHKTGLIKKNNFYNLDLDDIRIFVLLSFLNNIKNPNILDYGGAAGYHYYLFKNFYKGKISWNIIENNEFYNTINNEISNFIPDEVSYIKSVDEPILSKITFDFIFCSCSLQYSFDPFLTLKKLISLNSKYIYITRFPLLEDGATKIYIQYSDLKSNGPKAEPLYKENFKISYPITFVNKEEFMNILSKNYEQIFSMTEDKNVYSYKNTKINLYGFLYKLKN